MPSCNICNCDVTKRCSKKINKIDYKICKNCKDNIQKTEKSKLKPKLKPGPKPKLKPGPKPKLKPGPKSVSTIQTQAVRLENRIVYFPKVPTLPIFPKAPTDKK